MLRRENNKMKRNEICDEIRKKKEYKERIEDQVAFINQKISKGESLEAALIQFQIDLRNCKKALHNLKYYNLEICDLCDHLDKRIIDHHKGYMDIYRLEACIQGFIKKFRKEIIAGSDKLERLLAAYDAIKAMYDAGDHFPEYILPEKFRDSFEN